MCVKCVFPTMWDADSCAPHLSAQQGCYGNDSGPTGVMKMLWIVPRWPWKKAGVAPPAGSARGRYDVDRHVHSGRRVWNGGRQRFETFNLQAPLSYLSSPYFLNSLKRTDHPKWNSLFPQTPCRLKVGWGFIVAKKEFRSFTAKKHCRRILHKNWRRRELGLK